MGRMAVRRPTESEPIGGEGRVETGEGFSSVITAASPTKTTPSAKLMPKEKRQKRTALTDFRSGGLKDGVVPKDTHVTVLTGRKDGERLVKHDVSAVGGGENGVYGETQRAKHNGSEKRG